MASNRGRTPDPWPDRCESVSPIAKFDEGSRRCKGKKGHAGVHYAPTSEGRYVGNSAHDYTVRWDNEGRFVGV